MTPVSFFTPVIQPNHPFMNAIERYTWFGGRVVEVVVLHTGELLAIDREEPSSFLATAFKSCYDDFDVGRLTPFSIDDSRNFSMWTND